MVLKQTSIHTSFFPSSKTATQDATTDPSGNVDVAGPAAEGEETPRNPSADGVKRSGSLKGGEQGNVILVDWDGPDDPLNPLNWSSAKKSTITFLLSIMCLFIGLATAGFSSGLTVSAAAPATRLLPAPLLTVISTLFTILGHG